MRPFTGRHYLSRRYQYNFEGGETPLAFLHVCTMAKGRYRIIRKIADGGMAEIYAGTQHGVEGFERPVVLKRILPTLLAEPQFKNLMIDEAHVAMSLTHGNIVQVLDLGQAKGHYYLVLELVDGWDLNQILNRVKAVRGFELPPTLALFIVGEVCRALAYAHGRRRDGRPMGIVHRDISPHNVLVSVEGEVKLTDFGIAKAMVRRGENTVQGVIKGKLAFMSPEQASSAPIDARSDLFSIGTLLYLMFTGKRPFEAPTDLESILRVQKADFVAPELVTPEIAPQVAAMINKAMQLRPSERYQTADAMLEAIEDVQRQVFGPSGKTELKRWLAELERKDHQPSIGRLPAPAKLNPNDTLELGDHDIEFEASSMAPLPTGYGATLAASGPKLLSGGDSAGIVQDEVGFAATSGQTKPERATPAPPAPDAASTTATVRPPSSRRAYLALGVLGLAVVGWWKYGRGSKTQGPVTAPAPPPVPQQVAPQAEAVDASAVVADAAAAASEGDDDDNEEALLAHAEPDLDQKVIGDDPDDEAPAPPSKRKPTTVQPKNTTKAHTPAPVVSVKIASKPTGAVVKLKKRVFGRAPLSLRFKAGMSYELTFVKAGYVPVKKKLTVTTKKNQSLTVALRRQPTRTKKNFIQRILGL